MRGNRLDSILSEKHQVLRPGEKLIYINGGVEITQYNDGGKLVEIIKHEEIDVRQVLKAIGYEKERLDAMSDENCDRELQEIYDVE